MVKVSKTAAKQTQRTKKMNGAETSKEQENKANEAPRAKNLVVSSKSGEEPKVKKVVKKKDGTERRGKKKKVEAASTGDSEIDPDDAKKGEVSKARAKKLGRKKKEAKAKSFTEGKQNENGDERSVRAKKSSKGSKAPVSEKKGEGIKKAKTESNAEEEKITDARDAEVIPKKRNENESEVPTKKKAVPVKWAKCKGGQTEKRKAADTEGKDGAVEAAGDIVSKKKQKMTHTNEEPEKRTVAGGTMRIISWNVAGLRSLIKKNAYGIIKKIKPDIVALQEIKCAEVPEELDVEGYEEVVVSSADKAGYAGVMLLSKQKPLSVISDFKGDGVDGKGRIILAEYEKFYLLNAYVPNSGRGLVNLEMRKKWDRGFLEEIKKLDAKKPVIYAGDLNVAHEEIDLANPKTNRNKTAGFTDDEREGFSRLLDAGFVDVYRKLNPNKEGAYTFWSNMHNARSKNVGWRLDYFVVSKRIENAVVGCEIHSDTMGSDHCPIELQINI